MPDWQDAEQNAENLQLIKEAQDGSAEAFGQLYERYADVVFRFLYAHLDNHLDAEDLTVDVFFRVWRSLPNFQDRGIPFGAFLFRVARNALIDHYRRSNRNANQVSIEDDQIGDTHADPMDMTAASMQREEIREILSKLREDYRTVLLLRFMADLSPEETAEVMGKSPGAVRVLQHRALAALRKLMDQNTLS
jgi:RNA polymerase sigma-70 factor (ECF subfamily)